MPIGGKFYTFSKENVNIAPDVKGVYALFQGKELIYYGRAAGEGVTIRSRLQDHFAGREGPCTQAATTYLRVADSAPVRREAELLEAYRQAHGRLPRCNDRAA